MGRSQEDLALDVLQLASRGDPRALSRAVDLARAVLAMTEDAVQASG